MTSRNVFVALGMMTAFLTFCNLLVLAQSDSASFHQSVGDGLIGASCTQVSTVSNTDGVKTGSFSLEGEVKILGQTARAFEVNCGARQDNLSPPSPRLVITVVGNRLFVSTTPINKNFSIISGKVGLQIFVGPIPVYLTARAGLAIRGAVPLSASLSGSSSTFGVRFTFAGGLSASITAAVGIPVAYIGVRGRASPLQASFTPRLTFRPVNISVTVDFSIEASADVLAVVRSGWIEYRHVLASWSHPFATWRIMDRTLWDRRLPTRRDPGNTIPPSGEVWPD